MRMVCAPLLRKTFQAARGCKLEITQRDVYTINGDIGKAKRYVDIVKEDDRNELERDKCEGA